MKTKNVRNPKVVQYIETVLRDNGISRDEAFTISNHKGEEYLIDIDFLIKVCGKCNPEIGEKIKVSLATVNFNGGDILKFFKRLAKAYIETNT